MKSHLTSTFRSLFSKLPTRVQTQAKKNYKLWVHNRNHPSLDFKRVHPEQEIYSIRVGLGWRALGVRDRGVIVWFWIGSHAEYNKMVTRS